MQIFATAVAIFSILGTVLNIYERTAGFYIWALTNASWIVVDLYFGVYPQAFLFTIYFALSIHGAVRWRRRDRMKKLQKKLSVPTHE